ncbi:MAG: alpha/beta hydrolase [Phycisphaerae bacterium]|nr:alpha/beta hydrolase [Saprospiraceae bacterium]
MKTIRPFALAKQIAAIPFHFVQHQWKGIALSKPEKHWFGPHWRQYLMFWMPPKDVPEQHSVVVFYHGGGWRLGWPDQFPTVADWFLRRGFPVVMPAYRLSPRFSYPDMRQDLNLALGKILELMETHGLSQKKLLIGGMSAGATLAAHIAFNRNELAGLGMSQNDFSGFFSFGGPLDLEKLPNLQPLRGYAGGPPGSESFRAANPITWLRESENLPGLLVHGTDDAIVPFESSVSFFEKYSGPKTLYPIMGGSHLDSLGFVLKDRTTAETLEKWINGLGGGE